MNIVKDVWAKKNKTVNLKKSTLAKHTPFLLISILAKLVSRLLIWLHTNVANNKTVALDAFMNEMQLQFQIALHKRVQHIAVS